MLRVFVWQQNKAIDCHFGYYLSLVIVPAVLSLLFLLLLCYCIKDASAAACRELVGPRYIFCQHNGSIGGI